MNGYRRMMIDNGENLGWCIPYISSDGKHAIAVNEGKVCGMILDGVDLDTKFDVNRFARVVNQHYSNYDGWDDLHIALEGGVSAESCSNCPWFGICDAMDNPDGWEDSPDSKDYPDD